MGRKGLLLLGLIMAICLVRAEKTALSPRPQPQLTYQVYNVSQSRVHTLLIPAGSGYRIRVAVGESLADLPSFVKRLGAIAVLNGGFFDPKNGQTTAFIRQNGQLVADPRENERLMGNPNLKSSLEQILNRSEWRAYECQGVVRYGITRHQQPLPEGCRWGDSLGAGPQLLPQLTAVEEAFVSYSQGKVVKDALGLEQPNARSAIALTQKGDVLWVMVEQQPRGLSLLELGEFLRSLGVVAALNLDGGSSSAFYYQERFIYGKLDSQGNRVKRPVKSVLWLEKSL